MRSRTSENSIINAPAAPFFFAAVLGVLFDAKFSPGLLFWRTVFYSSLFFLILFVATSMLRERFQTGLRRSLIESNPRFLLNRIVSNLFYGEVLAWIAAFAFFGARHEKRLYYYPESEIGRRVTDEGTVSSVELFVKTTPVVRRFDESSRPLYGEPFATTFEGEVFAATDKGRREPFSGRIAVSINGIDERLRVGDKATITGRLSRPARPRNPWNYDRVRYDRARRIVAELSAESPDCVKLEPVERFPANVAIARFFERVRKKADSIIRSRLSPRNASVARGMTLGFRDEIDEETNDSFRRTGAAHLLAISGLHIALAVGAFVYVLRRLWVPNVVVSLSTIFFVLFYLALTDARASAIRAATLIIVFCVGSLLRRRGNPLNSLALAALFLLALNPLELFQLGAQLSFLATGSFLWSEKVATPRERALSKSFRREAIKERARMVGASERQNSLFGKTATSANSNVENGSSNDSGSIKRFPVLKAFLWSHCKSLTKQLIEITKISCRIWIIGSPVLLRTTNLLTPVALVANPMLWLPATISLLLAFLLIAFGLGAVVAPGIFGVFVAVAGFLTNKAFDLFLGALDLMASPSFGAMRVPSPQAWALCFFYAPLVVWTLFPRLRPKRRWLSFGLFAWIALAVCAGAWERASLERSKTLRIDVLAIGHGCAVLGVFPDGRSFVYDCGSLSNSRGAAELLAKDLWNAQKTRVDLAIISHADFDHYGGFVELSKLAKIGRVCVSPVMFEKKNKKLGELEEALLSRKIPIEKVAKGDSLERWGFPELTILHPEINSRETDPESNANSAVAVVEYLGRRVMLPGDLDASDASFLEDAPKRVDVLLVPHHGGKSENAEALLQWSDPTFAVISGGSVHRNLEEEEKIRSQGREVLHTNDDGLIRIEIGQSKEQNAKRGVLRVRSYRSKKERFAID
ncbi:MAG: ComEC/Rec2 family competence protein [Thermoguttaceae bacterium]|nr:ComEC/Rec2 family competence protein [Thermoguttaceae bacterium]